MRFSRPGALLPGTFFIGFLALTVFSAELIRSESATPHESAITPFPAALQFSSKGLTYQPP